MLELLLLALIGASAAAFIDSDSSDSEPEPETDDVADDPAPTLPDDEGPDDPAPNPFPEDPDEEDGTPPVDPTPVDPTPGDPTPVDPTPVDPTPVAPTPDDPTPVDPTPVDPTPVAPTPDDPTPVDPTPVDPTPVDPTPVDPTPVDPTPTDPPPPPPAPAPSDPTPVSADEAEPVEPTIDPTQVPVPPRDVQGRIVIQNGTEQRGNADDNFFIGPTLTVDTPMGPISAPGGPFEDATIHMGRGNDSLAGAGDTSAVYGNGGNDYIEVVGGLMTLSGGADDDVIIMTSSGGSHLVGGLGNDGIQITRDGTETSGDTVWGGDGDDTLHAYVGLGDGLASPLEIYGGAGADTFGIGIETVEAPAGPGGTVGGVTLMDFDPAQDSLTVILSTEAQLNYTGATLSNHPSLGYSELRLHFDDQGGGEPYEAVIRLNGTGAYSVNDIDLRLET